MQEDKDDAFEIKEEAKNEIEEGRVNGEDGQVASMVTVVEQPPLETLLEDNQEEVFKTVP